MFDTIQRGIRYLVSQQKSDGSFDNLSTETDFTNARTYTTTFFSSLILSALTQLPQEPEVVEIKKCIATFLLSQKSPLWTFNYWKKDSDEMKKMPYPDDLDDTACALAALTLYDQSLLDGAAFARIVEVLTAFEQKEGGPYYTWLLPEAKEKKWKDIDLAVNSNIGYFLSLHKITLPGIDAFIEKHIRQRRFISPYYASFYPLIYFIARWYNGKQKQVLSEELFSYQKNGIWENPLNTALAVSSLLRLGVPSSSLAKSITYLQKMQQANGQWDAYIFCKDPTIEGKPFFAGSSALTTACCLEAISLYEATFLQEVTSSDRTKEVNMYETIINTVIKQFILLDTASQKDAVKLLNHILQTDVGKQVALLPFYFRESLGSQGKKIPDTFVIELGVANTLGWIAYTIYDDFFDEEGVVSNLAIANIALRKLTHILTRLLPKRDDFQLFFHVIMDRLDRANAWEVRHCRISTQRKLTLPRFTFAYQQLADKSLGHALGPLAIVFFLGFTTDSDEIKNLHAFFSHYLIARQLNDDAHDWEKDLARGHISPVGMMLLKKYKEKTQKEYRDFTSAKEALQEIFWYETIHEVCALISLNIRRAERKLTKMSYLHDATFLQTLLTPLIRATQEAQQVNKDTRMFLTAYTTSL
ncbi:MAG: hypothetical protein AAB553_07660 [Patescibacteria group bacterium]